MKKLLFLITILALTACGKTDAGNTFMDTYKIYKEHRVDQASWPQNPTEIGAVTVDTCNKNPQTICTSLLSIMKTDESTFYIKEKSGNSSTYYGPFKGNMLKIAEEAKKLDTIKE